MRILQPYINCFKRTIKLGHVLCRCIRYILLLYMMGPRGNKSSEPTCHSWQMANRSFNFSCISPHQIAFLNSLFPFYQTNATPKTTIIIKKKMFMVSCDAYLLANKSQWIGGIYRNIPRLNYNGHHHHWSILASDHTQSKFQSSMQSHSHIILVTITTLASSPITLHTKGVNSFDRLPLPLQRLVS